MCFRYQVLLLLILPPSLVHSHTHLVGHLLHGSGMSGFPTGTYSSVKVLNFLNNNFGELKPYILFNHGFKHLEKALLRNNNISYIHPNAFAMTHALIQLDLYGNSLVAFHKNSFAGLESLQNLHLGNNKIVHMDESVLEPLTSLETLDLSGNSLTVLQRDFLRRSPVLELDLRGNELTFLKHGALLESSFLVRLSLQACHLKQLSSHAFAMLPKLEVLDLSRNELTMLPKGLLGTLPQLQYLDVSYNLISYTIDVATFYLPTKLNVLSCSGNPFEARADCAQLLVALHSLSIEADSQGIILQDNLPGLETTTIHDVPIAEMFKSNDGDVKLVSITTMLVENHESTGAVDSNQDKNNDKDITENNTDTDEDEDEDEDIYDIWSDHKVKDIAVTTTAEDIPESYTAGNSDGMDNMSNALIYSIIGVSIICLMLLGVLLAEICYLMKQYDKQSRAKLLRV